jgi:hypothetical protein
MCAPNRPSPAGARCFGIAPIPITILILATLALAPRQATATDILNGITRTPPCDWVSHASMGVPPPPGYGYQTLVHDADKVAGTVTLGTDEFMRSDITWGTTIPNSFWVYANLGMSNFVCTRTGSFTMDASVRMNGVAGIFVPCAQDWRGGADAYVKVTLRMFVNDVTNFPLVSEVAHQDFVLYEYYSRNTLDPPMVWNDAPIQLSMSNIPLSSGGMAGGPAYEAIVRVVIDGTITVTAWNCGGYVRAQLYPGTVDWFGRGNYYVNGYSGLVSMTVRDQSPDFIPPTTVMIPPSPEPGSAICDGWPPVCLSASDPAGGFGMGTTYYRVGTGPVQSYTSPIFLTSTDSMSYWSVDRVGNEEIPHHRASYQVIWPPAAPAHWSLPDGATGVTRPAVLQWNPVSGADRYRLQVDDDPGFGSPSHDVADTCLRDTLLDIQPSTTYHWRVASHEPICGMWGPWSEPWSFTTGTVVAVEDRAPRVPVQFAFGPNQPNPFHGRTTIRFDLPKTADVRVEVFHLDGRRVATLLARRCEAGSRTLVWDGTDTGGCRVPAGVYFCRIKAGEFEGVRRMIALR